MKDSKSKRLCQNALNALSDSKIVDNSQTITKDIEQIPTGNRTYIP